MSKKRRFSREFKEALLREHDETGISYWKLGKQYQIDASTIRRWRNNAKAFGTESLEHHNCNLCNYAAEFKKQVVEEHQKNGRYLYRSIFNGFSIVSLYVTDVFIFFPIGRNLFCPGGSVSVNFRTESRADSQSFFYALQKRKKGDELLTEGYGFQIIRI